MRPDGINPLDLNNFPEDNYAITRDHGKQISVEYSSSSSAAAAAGIYAKKKGGGKAVDEAAEKVYECRFCSLKFCKSQALGGHMNRHRQERETETLNKARELVFTNDVAPCYVPGGQSVPHGGFHHHHHYQEAVAHNLCRPDNAAGLPFRPLYSPRMFPAGLPPYTYPSGHHIVVGHAVSNLSDDGNNTSYTCVGAPVVSSSVVGVRDEDVGLNWIRR